jgi:hypothetical protein
MRRRVAAFAVLLALSGAAPSLAQDAPGAVSAQLDPENLALAREIIDLSYPPETRHAMLSRTSDAMMAQTRTAIIEAAGVELDAGAQQILQRYMDRVREISERSIATDSPPLFAAFARAYARHFTRQELIEIRAFVRTPTGARYIQQSMDLLADPDVAQANTAYMTRSFGQMQPLLVDLAREVREYLESRERPTNDARPGTR